jgi:hypothetical protein
MRFVSVALVLILSLWNRPAQPQSVVPNFSDLTVKVRIERGFGFGPGATTYYFKGPRERIERNLPGGITLIGPAGTSRAERRLAAVTISECDLKVTYRLHPQNKTYLEFHLPDLNESKDRKFHLLRRVRTGPEVIVTFDSRDTGERKPVGSYEAHRIETTVTVEPSKGAETKPAKIEVDGWYLDIPGLGCMQQDFPAWFWQHPRYGLNDKIVMKHNGPEPHGIVIQGTAVTQQGINTIANRVKFLGSSDQALNNSLFEVPADYHPATPGHRYPFPVVTPNR